MKYAYLAASAALALAAPSFALACTAPVAPAALDGATASTEQVLATKEKVTAYLTASDDYQACVLEDLVRMRERAQASKTVVDPAIEKSMQAAVHGNQLEKEKVGADFNAAIKAYRAAHPG